MKRQPLFIVLTWGETKTRTEREHIRKEVISQCRKYELPLEDCIPYCSLGEEYLLDNYSEDYMKYFRACKEQMIKVLNGIKLFKKDQSRTYSTAKHGLFLKSLSVFQSDFAPIVSGFNHEVIERKYDKLIQNIRSEYAGTAEDLASQYAKYCTDKADRAGENDIAEIDFHLFSDHKIITRYRMAELYSAEKKELFQKISKALSRKSAFLKNSVLSNDANAVCDIYCSVVKSLIKKHDRPRSVWGWGFFGDGAYDMWENLIEEIKGEFQTSADVFLPKIKASLKPGVEQETRRLENEKKALMGKWRELEKHYSQSSKTIMEGIRHA